MTSDFIEQTVVDAHSDDSNGALRTSKTRQSEAAVVAPDAGPQMTQPTAAISSTSNQNTDSSLQHRPALNVDEKKRLQQVGKIYRFLQDRTALFWESKSDDPSPNANVAEVYGESTAGGFQCLLNALEQHKDTRITQHSQFLDIGSGFGKPVFHVWVATKAAQVHGIEYVRDKYQKSIELLSSMVIENMLPAACLDEIRFYCGDGIVLLQQSLASTVSSQDLPLQFYSHIYVYDYCFTYTFYGKMAREILPSMLRLRQQSLPSTEKAKIVLITFRNYKSWKVRIRQYDASREDDSMDSDSEEGDDEDDEEEEEPIPIDMEFIDSKNVKTTSKTTHKAYIYRVTLKEDAAAAAGQETSAAAGITSSINS